MAELHSKSTIVSYEEELIALEHRPELSDPEGSSGLGIETVERVDLCFNVLDSLVPKVGQHGVSGRFNTMFTRHLQRCCT